MIETAKVAAAMAHVTYLNEVPFIIQKEIHMDNTNYTESASSYFDGGLLGQIGIKILSFIIILFSAGLLAPVAICITYKWEAKHTVIDGRRLKFEGTAMGLFGNWIKWWLLTMITLGIYGFWTNIKVNQWKTKHIHFA